MHGAPRAWADYNKRQPIFIPTATNPIARLASTKQPVHIADMAVERAYLEREPVVVALVEEAGARTILGVPMLKDGRLIGAIAIYRQEVCPFTEKQISLMQNFASQAVIAIENTRLLNELRESLQQQTATADVLKVISSSPGELEPVFNAMLENATRICHAEFGTLYLRETDAFRAVAIHNAPPAYVQARKRALVRPPPDSALGQVVTTHQVAQIDDITKTKSYVERDPYIISAVELGGYRTIAAVPMLKDDELVGAILIYRQEVRSFSEKQIALLRNFADQAVIAIENTRLLNELRQRTGALSRVAGPPNGNVGSPRRYQQFADRFDTGIRYHPRRAADRRRLAAGNLAALSQYDSNSLWARRGAMPSPHSSSITWARSSDPAVGAGEAGGAGVPDGPSHGHHRRAGLFADGAADTVSPARSASFRLLRELVLVGVYRPGCRRGDAALHGTANARWCGPSRIRPSSP